MPSLKRPLEAVDEQAAAPVRGAGVAFSGERGVLGRVSAALHLPAAGKRRTG